MRAHKALMVVARLCGFSSFQQSHARGNNINSVVLGRLWRLAKRSCLTPVLVCGQVLLETNTAGNLQLVVQVAKEYTEQLGANRIMEMLESHKSYHGLTLDLQAHTPLFLPQCFYPRKMLHLPNPSHSVTLLCPWP